MATIILYHLVCGCIMFGTALNELDAERPFKCVLVVLYCLVIGGVMVPMLIGVLLDKYIEHYKVEANGLQFCKVGQNLFPAKEELIKSL